MDRFLALPEEVSRTIISEWVNITCLSKLDVAYCKHISREAFLALIAELRTLFSHSLIGRSNYFRYTEMLLWINNRKLYVKNFSIFTGFDAVHQEAVMAYLSRSRNTLERVDLHQMNDHTHISLSSAVRIITNYGANIKELGLSYLVNLSVSDLQIFATSCLKVQKLQLDYCDVISHLAKSWSNLTVLSLSHTLCSDEDLTEVVRGCAQLTHLNLSHCEVSDVSILAVAAHCPLLQFISLNEVIVLDESIDALARGCPDLREIILGVNENVTDLCLFSLTTHCLQLHTIDITECEQITDAGMECLAQRCPQLKHLDVSECLNVTDQGVLEVAQHCHLLQTLRVYESAFSDALTQLLGDRVTVCERFNQDDWMLEANMWRGDSGGEGGGDVHELDIDGERRGVYCRGRVNSDY